MKDKHPSRIVFGVFALILFCVYSYLHFSVSPHRDELNAPAQATVVSEPSSEPVSLTEEPSPTPESTPSPEPTPSIPDIDINSWEFMLVNGDNSIGEYAPPELTTLEEQQFDSRIIDALKAMSEDARSQGLSVYLSSGYRSYSEQAANFTRVCQNNGVADGKNAEGYYITMPAGCSEHQTGLCCDITDKYYPLKDSSLENTDLYKYLSQHCQEFGFIVRFPDGRQSVTGVMYEPFHFRYVGVDAATYIMEHQLCLEEFVAMYK